ncbi:MAG TPA: Uma2 family endonuclease [Gammaproteobacteria bacterium]|nr:Uma2 family endonuclease [Gammaproteobacteria bacterium]
MAAMTVGFPRRYRITAEEYFRMGETGVLAPDARVELIEGELIEMAPIGPSHASTVERLADLLRRALGDRAMFRTQQPSVVGKYSVPQPDVTVVIRRNDYYAEAHPAPADVLLAVEVADSTLRFDRDVKTAMYARSGVQEVWVVDVVAQRVMRSTSPQNGVYAETATLGVGESIGIGAFPDVRIDLSAIFPD